MSKSLRVTLLTIISLLIMALAISGILLLAFDTKNFSGNQLNTSTGDNTGDGSGTVTPTPPTSTYTDEKKQAFTDTFLQLIDFKEEEPTVELDKIRYDINKHVLTTVPDAIQKAGISADVFDKVLVWMQDLKKTLDGRSLSLYEYFEIDKFIELVTSGYDIYSGEWDELVREREKWVLDFASKLGELIDSAAPGTLGVPDVGEFRQEIDKLLNCGLTYTDFGKIMYYCINTYMDDLKVKAAQINKLVNAEIKRINASNERFDSKVLGYLQSLTISNIVDTVASVQLELRAYGVNKFAQDFRLALEKFDLMLGRIKNLSWDSIRNIIYSFINVDVDENGNYNQDQLTGAVRNLRDVMRGYADEYRSGRTMGATDYYGNTYDGYFVMSTEFYNFLSSARNKILPLIYILTPDLYLQGGDVTNGTLPGSDWLHRYHNYGRFIVDGQQIYIVAQLLLNPSTYTMLQNVANKIYDGLINVFDIMSNEKFLSDFIRVLATSVQNAKERTVSIANRGAIDDFYENYLLNEDQYGEGNMTVRIKEYINDTDFYPEDVTTIDQKLEYIYDFYYNNLYYGRIVNLAAILEINRLYEGKVANDINEILGLTKRDQAMPGNAINFDNVEEVYNGTYGGLIRAFKKDNPDVDTSSSAPEEDVMAVFDYFVEYFTREFSEAYRTAFGYVSPEDYILQDGNTDKQLETNMDDLNAWIELNITNLCTWVVRDYEINCLKQDGFNVERLSDLQGLGGGGEYPGPDVQRIQDLQKYYDILKKNREVKPEVDRTLDYSKQKLVELTNSYIATIYGSEAASKFVNEGSGLETFESIYNEMLMYMRKGYIIQRLYPTFDYMNSFYNSTGGELSAVFSAQQVVVPRDMVGTAGVTDNSVCGIISKLLSAFIGRRGQQIYVGDGEYQDLDYDGLSGYTMQSLMEEFSRMLTSVYYVPNDLLTLIGFTVNAIQEGDTYYFTVGNMDNPIYLATQDPETKIYERLSMTSRQFGSTLSSICNENGQLMGLIAYPLSVATINGITYITEVEIKSNYSVASLLENVDIEGNKDEIVSMYNGYSTKAMDAIKQSLKSLCLDTSRQISSATDNVNELNDFLDIYINELNRRGYDLLDKDGEVYKALNIVYDLYVFLNDVVYRDPTQYVTHNLSETRSIDDLLVDLGSIMLNYNFNASHGSSTDNEFLLKRYYIAGSNVLDRLTYVYNYVQKFVEFTNDPIKNNLLYKPVNYNQTISDYDPIAVEYSDPITIDSLIEKAKQELLDYAELHSGQDDVKNLTEAKLSTAVEVWTPVINKIITLSMFTGLYKTGYAYSYDYYNYDEWTGYYDDNKEISGRQFSDTFTTLSKLLGGKSSAGTWVPFGLDYDLMTGTAVPTQVSYSVLENDTLGFDFYKQFLTIWSYGSLNYSNLIQTWVNGFYGVLEDFNSIELFKEVDGAIVTIDDDRYYNDVFTVDDLADFWNDYVTQYNKDFGTEIPTVELGMGDDGDKYQNFDNTISDPSVLQALGIYEQLQITNLVAMVGDTKFKPLEPKEFVLIVINMLSHYKFMNMDMKTILYDRFSAIQFFNIGRNVVDSIIEIPGDIMNEALYNALLLLPTQGAGALDTLLDILDYNIERLLYIYGITRY